MLGKAAGIQLTYIPFGGTGSAIPALLGGHVTALMSYSTMGVQYAGKFRALAIASEDRMEVLPDVPTFKELGYDIVEGAYRGVAAPPGTPDEVVKILADAFERSKGSGGQEEDGPERLQDGVHGSRGLPGPGEEEDGRIRSDHEGTGADQEVTLL